MTRRDFELILISAVLLNICLGTIRVWSHKTFNSSNPSSLKHKAAEFGSIVT